jgi:hypothetical protein
VEANEGSRPSGGDSGLIAGLLAGALAGAALAVLLSPVAGQGMRDALRAKARQAAERSQHGEGNGGPARGLPPGDLENPENAPSPSQPTRVEM